jgi:hypothetical protein
MTGAGCDGSDARAELGGENVIVLPPLADATNDAKFYAKALPFLRAHTRTMSRFRSGGETSL